MQHDFWHQRWQQNQIGFHSPEINPHLQRFWPSLAVNSRSRVFLPLCGKSKDMLWLLAQGYQVVGVELSPMAVEAFFAENDLHPTVRRQGNFLVHQIDGLEIFCGDFFELSTTDLGKIDVVYDRAALVALPPDMRFDYVTHLAVLLEPGSQILLVTFEYPQHEMPGPPFSVPGDEIEMMYRHWCTVDLLTSEDALQRELHFQERGLGSLNEQVYRLVVR
jgi:thiopurine S-methyltransferase